MLATIFTIATHRASADAPALQPVSANPQAIAALNRGDAAFAKHDLPAAIAEYTNAASADPTFEAAFTHCGDAQTVAHHFTEALAQYQKAIDLGAGDTKAYLQHARCAYQLNDVATAIHDCDIAISYDMRCFDAYMFRGSCYMFNGDFDTAIADYAESIALEPNNPSAWYAQGYAFAAQLQQPNWVVFDMTQVIRLNPHFALAYTFRGAAYTKLQKYKECLADETQSIKLDPHDSWPHVDAGEAYLALKDMDHASAEFNQAIQMNPQFAEAYNDRGCCEEGAGNLDQAIEDYRTAIKCNSNLTVAQTNLQSALSRRNASGSGNGSIQIRR